jgi:hypothetical protein
MVTNGDSNAVAHLPASSGDVVGRRTRAHGGAAHGRPSLPPPCLMLQVEHHSQPQKIAAATTTIIDSRYFWCSFDVIVPIPTAHRLLRDGGVVDADAATGRTGDGR